MPEVSTQAMNLFLAAFSKHLAAGEHALISLEQAGWHGAKALHVPDNITLVPFPPYSPELNPVERLWLYLRERYLSHRLLDDYDVIVDACCQAGNQLTCECIRSLCNYPFSEVPQPVAAPLLPW
jgi:transposase